MRGIAYSGLFLLALVVRLIYLGEWHDTALFSVLIGDGRQYDLWAREISGGDWFGKEVFYQAPMYPYFLAFVYRLFGHDLWILRIVQVVLGSTSCLLLALAGRRFFNERVGLTAGFLLALYAPAIYFDGLVQKGVLGVFCMTLLLFTLGEYRQRHAWPWLLGAGCTLGIFALTRENALILPPLVVAWVLLQDDRKVSRRRLVGAAVLLAGLTLVLLPVGLRNQALGSALLEQGFHDEAAGHYLKAIDLDPRQAAAYNNMAVLLARSRRPEEAIPYWEKALELSPDDVDARTNLGMVLLALGRVDEARAHYRLALDLVGATDALRRLDVAIQRQEQAE